MTNDDLVIVLFFGQVHLQYWCWCYLVYALLVRHGQEDVRLRLPGVGGQDGGAMEIIGWVVGLEIGFCCNLIQVRIPSYIPNDVVTHG